MSGWKLPTSVTVCGQEFAIRSDYRAVLDAIYIMAIKSKARHDLTLRSIKREIAAGRDVAYWLDKAYTHLDSGLLTEDDITEVETLAQAYYDALDAEDKANAEEITQ